MNAKELENFINNYPTKNKEGFTPIEIEQIIKELSLDTNTFYDKLGVNTCMTIDNEVIIYHCDVYNGVICTIENRNQTLSEWD